MGMMGNGQYLAGSGPAVHPKQLGRKMVAYSKNGDDESYGSESIASDVGEIRTIAKNSNDPDAGFVVFSTKEKTPKQKAKIKLGNKKKA